MEGLIPVLSLLPALAFFGFASARKKYAFAPMALFAGVMAAVRIVFEFWDAGLVGGFIAVGQTLFAVLWFVVMVFFVGRKVAGETLLLLCATVALVPLFWELGVVMIVGLGGATIAAARKWNQVHGDKLIDLGVEAAFDIGVMTRTKPDLSRLPEKDAKPADMRVSTAPWHLLGVVIALAITILLILI